MMPMLFAWWALAYAAEPPLRPDPPEPLPTDAPDVAELLHGQPLPLWLVDKQGRAQYDAMVLPRWRAADYRSLEEHLGRVERLYLVETTVLDARVAILEGQVADRDARIEALQAPEPWLERAATQRWMGRMETLATVVAVGWSVCWVAPDCP